MPGTERRRETGIGIMLFGAASEGELEVIEGFVQIVDQRQVHRHGFLHRRVSEALSDTAAIRLVSNLLVPTPAGHARAFVVTLRWRARGRTVGFRSPLRGYGP